MLISFDLGKSAANILYKIALKIDSVIYSLVNYLYKLFLILSRTRIINESVISPIIKRVYIILGVVMLFVLAYSLLKAIVNPATKDKSSAGKTVASVIKAVILMAIIPTIFDFAYQFQDAILSQNTIGKLILGVKSSERIEYGNTSAATIKELINGGGMEMATSVLKAFIVPTDSNNPNPTIGDLGLTYDNIWERTQQEGDFSSITKFSSELAKQEDESQSDYEEQYIDYSVLISTFAGAFIAWMLGGYCLSLGKRVIKLAFMEIIAPVPVILSVIPSKAQTLKDWIKDAVTLYIEVFLRIAILYISVYLISKINIAFNHDSTTIFGFEAPIRYTFMAKAIIIMGLIAFCKSAPELIGKYFGAKTDNLQNGIRNQLKEGGLFTAGAMVGGALTSSVRGIGRAGETMRKAKSHYNNNKKNTSTLTGAAKAKARAGNFFRGVGLVGSSALGIGRIFTSGISGGISSYSNEAGSFSDMRKYATSGAAKADSKYQGKIDRMGRYHGKGKNAVTGRAADFVESIGLWASSGGADKYEKIVSSSRAQQDKGDGLIKSVGSIIEDYGRDNTVSGNVSFKGSAADVTEMAKMLKADKASHKTLGQMKSELAILESTDPTLAIDRASYSSDDAYAAALADARNEHAKKVALFKSYYNQVKKASTLEVITVIEKLKTETDPATRKALIEGAGLGTIDASGKYEGWMGKIDTVIESDIQQITDSLLRDGGSISYEYEDEATGKKAKKTISSREIITEVEGQKPVSQSVETVGVGKWLDAVTEGYKKRAEKSSIVAERIKANKATREAEKGNK